MTLMRPMVVVPMFWIVFSVILGLVLDIDSTQGQSTAALSQTRLWDNQTNNTVAELVKEPQPDKIGEIPVIGFVARFFGYIERTMKALWAVQTLTLNLSDNDLGLPDDAVNLLQFFGLAMNLAWGVDMVLFFRSG